MNDDFWDDLDDIKKMLDDTPDVPDENAHKVDEYAPREIEHNYDKQASPSRSNKVITQRPDSKYASTYRDTYRKPERNHDAPARSQKPGKLKWVIIIFASLLIIGLICVYWYLLIPVVALLIAWKIYEVAYFRGEKFASIKDRIQSYINDCNDLNRHIEALKETHIGDNRLDSGSASYHDNSKWNFKRAELSKRKYAPNIYNCSRTVCDGASKEPFKYLCKYFNIKADEETLSVFETMLNNFEAAEDGKIALQTERESILNSIQGDVPALIKMFSKKRLEKELGFEPIDLKTAYFPVYIFKYISSGGNASTQCDIVMDIDNLNKFVKYLSEKIKFKKSVAGQRALMTSKLRQAIKERDGFACRKCGVSVSQEPNLLLEIDHIIPVSKGGLTTEDNLQTLCWRCNRSKGAKMA